MVEKKGNTEGRKEAEQRLQTPKASFSDSIILFLLSQERFLLKAFHIYTLLGKPSPA